jgi:hypothetical protein
MLVAAASLYIQNSSFEGWIPSPGGGVDVAWNERVAWNFADCGVDSSGIARNLLVFRGFVENTWDRLAWEYMF